MRGKPFARRRQIAREKLDFPEKRGQFRPIRSLVQRTLEMKTSSAWIIAVHARARLVYSRAFEAFLATSAQWREAKNESCDNTEITSEDHTA